MADEREGLPVEGKLSDLLHPEAAAIRDLTAQVEQLTKEREQNKHSIDQLRREWKTDRESLRRYREALERLVVVASQYMDSGRGDLDGELERARAASGDGR